jgi:hypothetical protein
MGYAFTRSALPPASEPRPSDQTDTDEDQGTGLRNNPPQQADGVRDQSRPAPALGLGYRLTSTAAALTERGNPPGPQPIGEGIGVLGVHRKAKGRALGAPGPSLRHLPENSAP